MHLSSASHTRGDPNVLIQVFSGWAHLGPLESCARVGVCQCNFVIIEFTNLHITLQVVQPDVVLASFDALASDISHLQPIDWEAVVVDERCKVQSNLAKAHQSLRDVESNFRLLLPSGNPTLVRPRRIHNQPIVPMQSTACRPSFLSIQLSELGVLTDLCTCTSYDLFHLHMPQRSVGQQHACVFPLGLQAS